MESLAKLHHHHHQPPLHLRLSSHRRRPFPEPISSLFFFRPLPPSSYAPLSSSFKSKSIRASSSPPPSSSYDPPTQSLQLSPLLQTACISIASASLFLMRVHPKPAIAAPVAPPMVEPLSSKESAEIDSTPMAEPLPSKESAEDDSIEGKERTLVEHLSQNPNDVEALRSLMEVRFKACKFKQSIEVIECLIQLEPEKFEWPWLKMYTKILVDVASTTSRKSENLVELVERTMERCRREKWRAWNVRDFMILIAHIRVVQGKFKQALNVYKEIVKEEPRDFRPYLCQGFIYTLLRRDDEAKKEFEKFNRLVANTRPFEEFYNVTTLPPNRLVAENFLFLNTRSTFMLFREVENERQGWNSIIGRFLVFSLFLMAFIRP